MFVDEGIEQVEGCSGHRVRIDANDAHGKRTIEGTDLLVATGRKANTDGLGLELNGLQLDQHGYIKVNERLVTTSQHIWAMGDGAGSPMFTHVAVNDFSAPSSTPR